jgi:hypothetical protein
MGNNGLIAIYHPIIGKKVGGAYFLMENDTLKSLIKSYTKVL